VKSKANSVVHNELRQLILELIAVFFIRFLLVFTTIQLMKFIEFYYWKKKSKPISPHDSFKLISKPQIQSALKLKKIKIKSSKHIRSDLCISYHQNIKP
jgi:hypothetical protein